MANTKTWQELADEINKLVVNDKTKIVAYRSDDAVNCKPEIIDTITVDSYPYVLEAPTGMVDPKYNWLSRTPCWEEQALAGQAKQLSKLSAQLADVSEQLDQVVKAQAQLLLLTSSAADDEDSGGSK